ncbi:Tfp pilus assembly protein PilF [Nitzschia inconspicua]|uniref:Tfp pilus assembly protein PilF n=1 Tax=Nitzschia inconspicua TaxID=303405 RepID=A0A9K3PMP8_9STRA|nr:Tfp pilus assembly protein PilF [Nitzschia inconspicua]
MIPLETSLDGARGAGNTRAGRAVGPPPQPQNHRSHPKPLQHQQQTATSPASFSTHYNNTPLKISPTHITYNQNNTPTPPPLPYRSTGSTASATTPSNSGHSRTSRGSHKSSGTSGNNSCSTTNNNNAVVSSYSSLATQSIALGKYRQAYEYYQLALQDYLSEDKTVVELVNAAATSFNLGALAKKLQEYPQAARYFSQAQEMYQKSTNLVAQYARTSGSRTEEESSVKASPSSNSMASSSSSSCQVCLLQLLVETLQARAHLHYKYQSLIDDAIACHEQVVDILDDETVRTRPQVDATYFRIHFTVLSPQKRWNLLATSLQSLGKFYVEKGKMEDAIISYKEALTILRKLGNEYEDESTNERQQEISHVIGAVADMLLQTTAETRDVGQLERLALIQEDLEHWDKAMQCWERVLYCQSQDHGEASVEVSSTLTKLAHIMIVEGNVEGSLDLYLAAANIFLKNKAPLPQEIFAQILELYKELDQVSGALAWLKAILPRTGRRGDQAKIHYELGKLYLEQGIFHAAADSLSLSSELFNGEDDSAHELLKKVESLQSRSSLPGSLSSGICRPVLTAITEDGESALAFEEDFSIDDAIRSLNATMTDESNDDSPADNITIDSLVRKAKAMEGEQLDALVNSTTHALVTSNVMSNDPHDRSSANVLSDLSSSLTSSDISPQKRTNTTTYDDIEEETEGCSSEGQMNSDEDGRSARSSAFAHEEDKIHELDPDSVAMAESASKGTEKTEPSVSSSPGGQLDTTRNDLYSAPAYVPNFISDDSCTDDSPSNVEEEKKSDQGSKTADMEYADRGDVYESFQRDHDSISETHDSAASQDINPPLLSDETPSPMISTTSRTGLLDSNENIRIPHKSLSVPPLSSSRTAKSRSRKGYTEVTEKVPSQRRRLVKALASPFRRSRSKSRSLNLIELDPLDEENEVRIEMPVTKTSTSGPDEETVQTNVDAPVSFISLRGRVDEDDDAESLVSQITFRMEEPAAKTNVKDGQWWWGVTAEGLEGWFPSSYVHQAVEAAEGFLSAKAIHDRVKSRPLDFDSDEESEAGEEVVEDISLARDGSSKQSKTNSGTASKGALSKPSTLGSQKRKISTGSGSMIAVTPSKSEGSKFQAVDQKIEDKKIHLETLKTLHGPDDILVGRVLFELAELHNKISDSDNALAFCQQALLIQKSTMNLSEACKTLHFMADIHSKETRYTDALSCYSEAQRLEEALFGYFHEETANTLNRIGNVLARQGEFDHAMENHKEALRILKECCGENVKHPLVSQTLIQIGAVYYKERNSLATIQSKFDGYTTFIEGGMLEIIGRAHEDRGSYRMAIAFFEEKLQFLNDGENSNDLEEVAETLNSLGMLSCRAGLYLEAIDYYDRALGIQMKLGCDDVQLAMAKVLAGSVQYSLGHYKKASALFQNALDTLCEKVGPQQETVAACLFHMGIVRAALCEYDEAMSNLQDSLDIQSTLLGPCHPATLRTRREIGNLYAIYEAELEAAFEEFEDVLDAQKQIHGEKHPNVAETLHSIGCAQAKKGDLQTALRTFEECYNMRLEFLGMDHPQQATTLHEIAKIQLKRNRLKKALHIIDAALNIRIESLSEQHIDVALALSTKASCLVARGNFNDAQKLFAEALSIATASLGERHPSVASIHVQIGVMHLRTCDFEEASTAIQTALDIYRESNLDEDHPGIKEATEELERVERAEMLCV